MTYTSETGRKFNVKEVNGRFYYFSTIQGRWFPIAKAKVSF